MKSHILSAIFVVFTASTVFAGYPAFDAPVTYSGGAAVQRIISDDLNNDGAPDLATSSGSTIGFGVLLNNGDGTFAPKYNVYLGYYPSCITAADFDYDGNLDIASGVSSTGGTSTSLAISIGNGDGTFQSPVFYTADYKPNSIVTSDFDSDGFLDIATGNYNNSTVSVFFGNGDGTFQASVDYPAAASPSTGVVDIITADFNGDTIEDIAVSNEPEGAVYILLNNGSGTFLPAVPYYPGVTPRYLASADINNDGITDLAVTAPSTDQVAILANDGYGSFTFHSLVPAGDQPVSIVANDFDNDSDIDLAVSNNQTDEAGLLWNKGDGTFFPVDGYATNTESPSGISFEDFDGNGKDDLAVAHFMTFINADIAILNNLLPTSSSQSCACCTLAPGDTNGDAATNILDITQLINFLYNGGPLSICQ